MATTPARLDIAKESSQQNLIETQKMVPLGSNDDEDDKTHGHEMTEITGNVGTPNTCDS